MKKKSTAKKSLKRQLLSGTIYVALAAVVVAVAVNTTVGILSDKTQIPSVDEKIDQLDTSIPKIPDIPELSIPEVKLPEFGENPVSGTQDGIDSLITEIIPEAVLSEPIGNAADTSPDTELLSIPEGANLGLEKFIKPCNGYVAKSHSVDMPVYSPTMSDYRTHTGVDVVEDLGTQIVCVSGGIVTDIYNDDLYGTTVEIKNREGYTVRYSNLMPELCAEVKIGSILKTGDNVGGIGETALCEAIESPHVHLEIYDPEGNCVDPEDLISF